MLEQVNRKSLNMNISTIKVILLFAISLSKSQSGFAIEKIALEEKRSNELMVMGNYLYFSSEEESAGLYGLSILYDYKLTDSLSVDSAYTQAYSTDGILTSVLSKFDFGIGYKLLGGNNSGKDIYYKSAKFTDISSKASRSISIGAGLSVSSFKVFSESVLLSGLYTTILYNEPITDALSFATNIKYDYQSTQVETLQVVSVGAGLTYKFN